MKKSMLSIFRKVTSGSASIAGLCIKLVLKNLLETGDFEFVTCCCMLDLYTTHLSETQPGWLVVNNLKIPEISDNNKAVT